jgi:hypothetical protein
VVLLSGATSAEAASSVYVANTGDNSVSQYTIGSGGKLVAQESREGGRRQGPDGDCG